MIRIAVAATLCLVLTSGLALALLMRPEPVENLPQKIGESMVVSGVDHDVTAVLLNFRSLDTLLEVTVLLVAVVVALALREVQPDQPAQVGLENPLLRAAMSWLLPLMLLVGGYLLWAGSSRPGGAFQAGAVLAAVGVLLRLAGVTLPGVDRSWLLRIALVFGVGMFVTVGAAVMLFGGPFLAYPQASAGTLIVLIELALTLSIGLSLVSMFRLAPQQPEPERGPMHGEEGGRR